MCARKDGCWKPQRGASPAERLRRNNEPRLVAIWFPFRRRLRSRCCYSISREMRNWRRIDFKRAMRLLIEGFVKAVRRLYSLITPARSYFFLKRRNARSMDSPSWMVTPIKLFHLPFDQDKMFMEINACGIVGQRCCCTLAAAIIRIFQDRAARYQVPTTRFGYRMLSRQCRIRPGFQSSVFRQPC